jgi:hypothetical protein
LTDLIKALQTPLGGEAFQNVTEFDEQIDIFLLIIILVRILHAHLVVKGHFHVVILKFEIVGVDASGEGLWGKDT